MIQREFLLVVIVLFIRRGEKWLYIKMRIGPIELLSVDTDKKDKRWQKELGKKLMRWWWWWWWRWRDDLRHCILLSPLLGVLVVDGAIGLVDARDFGHEWIVRVRVAQEWAYGEEHFGDGERWRPLRAQYVQADAAVAVYVRVVDARRECDLAEREREKDSFLFTIQLLLMLWLF